MSEFQESDVAVMPNWNQLLDEIRSTGGTRDVIRRRYLARIHEITARAIIACYSGWLQRREFGLEINDEDKNGLMTVVHGLEEIEEASRAGLSCSTILSALPS